MNCQVVGKLFDIIKEVSNAEPSEISFLKAVDHNEVINAVELSNKMDVTRSAVTQMINKLESRNLIERYSKPDNKKEKYLKLTGEGNKMLEEFEQNHRDANDKMCSYISNLNDSERETVIEFLDNLKDCMPISNFECLGRRNKI